MLTNRLLLRTGFLFLVFLALSANILAGEHHLIEEKKFPASAGGKLKVEAPGTDIKVEGWGSNEINVRVYGNDYCTDKYDIIYEDGGNSLYIKVKKRGGTWSKLFSVENCGLNMDIKVPHLYHTYLETAGGDLKLNNVQGDQKLSTAGGDISVKYAAGKLVSSTAGGDIVVDKFDGPVKANTTGGDIKAKNVLGDVSLSTSGGDIEIVSKNGKIEAASTGGDIKVLYDGESKGVWLSSTGGDINVHLKSGVKANMVLSTAGGDVDCNLSTTRIRKSSSHKFEAEINGGGPEFKVTTSGGDIRVWED